MFNQNLQRKLFTLKNMLSMSGVCRSTANAEDLKTQVENEESGKNLLSKGEGVDQDEKSVV